MIRVARSPAEVPIANIVLDAGLVARLDARGIRTIADLAEALDRDLLRSAGCTDFERAGIVRDLARFFKQHEFPKGAA